MINKALLVKNTVISFFGQIIPLIAALFCIPLIFRSLGADRFGILSLAWIVLGYLTFFDLGIGRAVIKFVAEAAGDSKEHEIPPIIWAAVAIQLVMGLIGALVLTFSTPFLVSHLFKIPAELIDETCLTFYLLAIAIPVAFVSSSFAGALEALQKFGLLNIIKVPVSISIFILPLVGISFGLDLPGIVLLILAVRLLALLAFAGCYFRIFPVLHKNVFSLTVYRKLFSFGIWITLTNIVIPVFIYLDRFLIGAILSIGELAYYAASYEMVTRLLVIPASVAVVVFPAFSSLTSKKADGTTGTLFTKSTKYILIAMVPIAVIFLIYAKTILLLWLGADFALRCTGVLRLLSIAMLLNALGYVPFTLIQGMGRPDVVAKYHLIELPIYATVAFFLIRAFGINGAALAWCLRMCWTIPIFFIMCARFAGISTRSLLEHKIISGFAASGAVIVTAIIMSFFPIMERTAAGGFTGAALLAGYGFISWRYTFGEDDRLLVRNLILSIKKSNRGRS